VLVGDAPAQECCANTWIVNDTSLESISVDIGLLHVLFAVASATTLLAMDINLSDVNLKAKISVTLDDIRHVLA